MAEIIRRIEERDFEAVSAIYDGRKSVEELKWLFTDPDDSTIYNAFVALKGQDEIIGVIGYLTSIYIQNKTEVKGVIPISWKIKSNYKGIAGITLFKEVFKKSDFGITIEGSKSAQNLYSIFKFKYFSNIDVYYKILNIPEFYNSLNLKNFFKKTGLFLFLLPSFFRKTNKESLYKDVEFINYDGNNFLEDREYDIVFKKKITKNYIDWLLDCPILDTYAFNIKKGKENLGVCILYIQKINNVKKGRIVHIPFLGFDNNIWNSVIKKCLTFFRKEGCCVVTGLAHHKMSHLGFVGIGSKKIKKHHKPLFIKDINHNLTSINLDNWHLQYSEGDKAYRGI